MSKKKRKQNVATKQVKAKQTKTVFVYTQCIYCGCHLEVDNDFTRIGMCPICYCVQFYD